MPIYEYRCADCDHSLEVIQGFSDPAPDSCPSCKKPSLEKQMSTTSFQLKGSGWYTSDYKRAPAPKPPCGAKEASAAPCAQGADCPAPAPANAPAKEA